MRFVIREQPYETPLASGVLEYEQDGRPTGAVERWRLSSAVDGYQFLRVDLDARQAESGRTYLYHLVLHKNGRPERLQYRFWNSGLQVAGHVLLADGTATASRIVNGQRFEEEITVSGQYAFWFPSSVGLSLLASLGKVGVATAIGLKAPSKAQQAMAELSDLFALYQADVPLDFGDRETLVIVGQSHPVRPLSIRWADQSRTVWLDEHGAVLKMVRDDGLLAVAARYIRYK